MTMRDPITVWEIDWRAPAAAFAPLAGEGHAHLLHGGERSAQAEWSIIVAFPQSVHAARVSEGAGPVMDALQQAIDARALRGQTAVALPFVSGFVGFVGYEAVSFLEPSFDLPASPFAFPDIVFGYYEAAAVFSRRERRAYVAGRNAKVCRRLHEALGWGASEPSLPRLGSLSSNFTAAQYAQAVGEVIENILDGDYYQANLSHRLEMRAEDSVCGYSLYRRLARASDAGFGALLQYDDGDILSNSPERFFRITPCRDGNKEIVVEPVKGTRPRGANPLDDAAFAQELLRDPKDRAENIMIADLMRNDLSRLCLDPSICEETICELQSYADVHHLVSRISGALRPEVRFTDVLKALFPCGSITGAPKRAAMDAIARIEEIGRGPYCGAIGYVDDRGRADFSVAIRTMMLDSGRRRLVLPVGGGVTLRSDPLKEYEETIHKARAGLVALGKKDEAAI